MFRLAFILIATLAITLGLLVGTLNAEPATLDLLWIRLYWPMGLIVLAAATAGLLIGLALAWFFSVLPLRARLRRASGSKDAFGAPGNAKQLHD